MTTRPQLRTTAQGPEVSLSDSASEGIGLGWSATSTMLSGLALFGGTGWLLDQWWNTRWVTPIGVLLGLGLAIYAIVMRFRPAEDSSAPGESGSTTQTTDEVRTAAPAGSGALNRES